MEPETTAPLTAREFIVDLVERVGTTLVEAVAVYIVATPIIDEEFYRGLLVALVIAAANVIKVGLTSWVPLITNRWADLGYRVVSTFVVAVAGSLASVEWLDIIDMGFWRQTVHAAAIAGLALVKGLVAMRMRTATITPASLAPTSATLPPAA